MKVTITSAVALTKTQVSKLVTGLEKKHGSLEVDQVVDPAVIGGVKVRLGSTTYDSTVAARLNTLAGQLDDQIKA